MSESDWSRSADGDPAPQLRIVPAETSTSPHWHGLRDAANEVAFGSAWLALQCSRIAGVSAGLLLIRQFVPSARRLSVTWPARDLDVGDLLRLAETAYSERRMVVAPGRVGPDASPAQPVVLIVALPLGTAREPIAAAAIVCAGARAGSRHCPGQGAPNTSHPISREPLPASTSSRRSARSRG